MKRPQRVAIVHDWLVSMRGGEKVVETLCEMFPDATLFTLVYRRGMLTPAIERREIRTSYIQRLPFGPAHHQYYLPCYPSAIGGLSLEGFDLVISSSSAAAKGVRVPAGVPHICYCHTPMRYIWDQYEQYFGPGRAALPVRMAMRAVRGYLRRWDVETSKRVTAFIANSRNVQDRISRLYGRDSTVIYPPVDVDRFTPAQGDRGYYLILSALVPYKRVDIAVEAFNRLGKRLVVAGTGSEMERLMRMAGPNIEFRGWVADRDIPDLYAGCKALIFPGEEDFGIVPVEAMACGKPVVAFARGGALETVADRRTGIHFGEQNADSLLGGIDILESTTFNVHDLRAWSMRFSKATFVEQMTRELVSHTEA